MLELLLFYWKLLPLFFFALNLSFSELSIYTAVAFALECLLFAFVMKNLSAVVVRMYYADIDVTNLRVKLEYLCVSASTKMFADFFSFFVCMVALQVLFIVLGLKIVPN